MDVEDETADLQLRGEDEKEDIAIITQGYKSLEASFEEDFN